MTPQPAHAAPLASVAPAHPATVLKRPHPLLTVLRWELSRALASRATWILTVSLFGILLLLLGFSTLIQDFTTIGTGAQPAVTVFVTRNSLFGLAILLPATLIEFALFLPFVTGDGVSLDLKRRTHELLMTTSLPSRAYVWGRYLAGTLIALGMACVYLLALLVVALVLHLTQGNLYPALDLPGSVVIWAVVVLPPTLLLSSLCFAFGVLLPRYSNLIKAGAVFAWFMVGLVMQAYLFDKVRYDPGYYHGSPPAWWVAYETWQPTNTDAGHLFGEQFLRHLYSILDTANLSSQAIQQQAHTLEGQMPDLASFAWAHLILVAVGVAAVIGASFAFRRFRNDLA